MRPQTSRVSLGVLSSALALVSLTVGFGAVDLVSPWVLHEGTQVTDVGYGTLTGLVIPMGLLTQMRRTTGLLQVGAAAAPFLIAGLLADEPPLLVAAAVVAASTAVLALLHPAHGRCRCNLGRPSIPMLALAVAACAPGCLYGLHMAFTQRDGVLPADAHLGLQHWAALSAAALAALFAALLASLRTTGFAIPAFTAAAAVFAWGLACLAYPQSAGALSQTWAGLSIVWALTFAFTAQRELRRSERASAAPRPMSRPAS